MYWPTGVPRRADNLQVKEGSSAMAERRPPLRGLNTTCGGARAAAHPTSYVANRGRTDRDAAQRDGHSKKHVRWITQQRYAPVRGETKRGLLRVARAPSRKPRATTEAGSSRRTTTRSPPKISHSDTRQLMRVGAVWRPDEERTRYAHGFPTPWRSRLK